MLACHFIVAMSSSYRKHWVTEYQVLAIMSVTSLSFSVEHSTATGRCGKFLIHDRGPPIIISCLIGRFRVDCWCLCVLFSCCIQKFPGCSACPLCGIPSYHRDIQPNRQMDLTASLCQQLSALLSHAISSQTHVHGSVCLLVFTFGLIIPIF